MTVICFFGKIFILHITEIGIMFLLLTFLVFSLVWSYAYYRGITVIETNIYILLELCSFLVFIIYDFFYFIVLLELITVLLLLTYEGSSERGIKAMSLLFFYTLASGSFLLVIYVLREIGIFTNSYYEELVVFLIMLCGIFIKLPIFPVHYWLPEAHAEATTCGSLILAGVVLKIGFYGFLEFISFELLSSMYCNSIILTFFICGVYLCCCLLVQTDIKKIIAYSSIVHMHIAIAVYLVGGLYSIEACMYLVLNHGLISSGLFLCSGLYIDLEGTRDILSWQSSSSSQNFGLVMLFLILSNMGFPLTIGFWGEFYANFVILGSSFLYIFFFLLNQLFVVVYNLRLFWLIYSNSGTYIYITDGRVLGVVQSILVIFILNLVVFIIGLGGSCVITK